MKNITILGLILLSLIIVSCADSSTNPASKNDSYYPLAVGNSWEYIIEGYVFDGEDYELKQDTFSLEIISSSLYYEDYMYQFGHDGEPFEIWPIYMWSNDTLFTAIMDIEPILAQNMKKGDSIVYEDEGDYWSYRKVTLVEDTDTELTVNGHKYSDVAVLKTTVTETENDSTTVEINRSYYAKGVGLIKGDLWILGPTTLLNYHIEN